MHIIKDNGINVNQWKKKKLEEKIKDLENYFPQDISNRIHDIRKVGNKGAHQSGHKNLKEEELNKILIDLSKICEWTILSYFKNNGFEQHPWLPTIFSTLQPIYRIRILEDLFESLDISNEELLKYQDEIQDYHNKVMTGIILPSFSYDIPEREKKLGGILLIIDKLAMAYLKNKEHTKSIEFIERCFEQSIINKRFKDEMIDKLEMLWGEIDNLPISQSIKDTKNNFDKVISAVKKEEECLFVTLFAAVISQEQT